MKKQIKHIIAYGYFFKKGNGTMYRYGTSTVVNNGDKEDYINMQKSIAEALLEEENLRCLDDLVFNYFSILYKEEL